jgi:photosystem II stability/assembly factor-like uncharacterized protein
MRNHTHHRSQPLIDFTAPKSHHRDATGKYISTLLRLTAILLAATLTAHAQWDIEESHTTASLRGIHNVGGGVAWASGTHGTVRRTEDGGYLWQTCTIPPGAENLDFRGIQAFDENTAIVMSSGPGDQSRLYKTTDGCQTWTLVYTNPDKTGFWDAIQFSNASGLLSGLIAGDPVNGKFPLWWIVPSYKSPANSKESPKAHSGEAAFAASNTSLFVYSETFWLGTGGTGGAHVIRKVAHGGDGIGWVNYLSSDVPVGQHTESSGIFSLSFALDGLPRPSAIKRGVAVGGDYLKPNDVTRTAAFTNDGGKTWKPANTPTHGYRSSVAYDPTQKFWITVGPNGTDISRDDGRNWQSLKPSGYDPADDDKNWNALSLPFVVGPNGRIGKLRTITPAPSAAKP